MQTSTETLRVPTPNDALDPALQGVSIVVPSYNEEGAMKDFLEEINVYLDKLDPRIEVEVLIVNDGSKDGTREAVLPFVDERIRLVDHEVNRGYGAAIKTGVRNAKHPWILITDSDGTYPNRFIAEILSHRNQHEMVVGARVGANAHIPWLRRPPKWVLRKLASVLSRRNIPDLNSGLRVMRKDLLQKYTNILPDGFSLTTTITIAMLSAGHSVKYTQIDYPKRVGKSKIRPIADTLGFLKLIIRTVMYFDPLRIFVPFAGVFVLAAGAVGFGSYFYLDKLMDVTTVLLFVTGVQIFALGVLADLVNRRTD